MTALIIAVPTLTSFIVPSLLLIAPLFVLFIASRTPTTGPAATAIFIPLIVTISPVAVFSLVFRFRAIRAFVSMAFRLASSAVAL